MRVGLLNCEFFLVPNAVVPTFVYHTPYDIYRTETVKKLAKFFNGIGLHFAGVDAYGTGLSKGVFVDEYTTREQREVCRVIDWIKAQPWSDGRVGMIGFSYSGTSAMQIAARRGELYCAIPMACPADEHENDVWLMNGVPLLMDLFEYAMSQIPYNQYRTVRRLRYADLFMKRRFQSPHWARVRPEQIHVPLFCYAGWADTYARTAVEFYERNANVSVLLGPWDHDYAEESTYGQPYPMFDAIRDWLRGEPYSIRAFLLDMSCNEGAWFGSRTRVQPRHHVVTTTLSADLVGTVLPTTDSQYVYWTECRRHATRTPHLISLPDGLQNICGNIDIECSWAGVNGKPYLVYVCLERAGTWVILSACIYNSKRRMCAAKSTGVQVRPGDRLGILIDVNSYPFTWSAPELGTVSIRDVTVRVHFSEYPLEPIQPGWAPKAPVQFAREWTAERIVLKNDYERFEVTTHDGIVELVAHCDSGGSGTDTRVTSTDNGKSFKYSMTLDRGDAVIHRAGRFRLLRK